MTPPLFLQIEYAKKETEGYCSKQTSGLLSQIYHVCVPITPLSQSRLRFSLPIQTLQSPLMPKMSSQLTTKTMTQTRTTMTRLLRGSVALKPFSQVQRVIPLQVLKSKQRCNTEALWHEIVCFSTGPA